MSELALLVVLLAGIAAGSFVAQRFGLPAPVILVVVGSLLSFIPWLAGVRLPPEAVLLIFLPLLLYWESLTTSLREIRRMMRGIILTGTLLVAATASAIAAVLHLLGVPWGIAWIIGAALGPTDATAVGALGRGIPRRSFVVLQAESLINDGTALVIYALAVGTATGQIEPTFAVAGERLALSFVGGIVVGLATAWTVFRIRSALRDPLLVNLSSLLTPLLTYLLAESVHASGVLAVVVAGLYMFQMTPSMPSTTAASARQQGSSFWTLITFILNGALFVLIGLDLPNSTRELSTVSPVQALLLVGAAFVTILVTRYVFLNVSIAIIRLLDRRPSQRSLRTTHRGRLVSVMAGFRGAVSLAVALSVPTNLAGRDLVVFVTGTVVVLTLVVQGFALPRVIRWARLPQDTTREDELRIARIAATTAALEALPELGRANGVPEDVIDDIAQEYRRKLGVLQNPDVESEPAMLADQRRELTLGLIAVKRATVVRLRDDKTIDDTVLRAIQGQLDIEEVRLKPPATE